MALFASVLPPYYPCSALVGLCWTSSWCFVKVVFEDI
jgi:hypothetical protein